MLGVIPTAPGYASFDVTVPLHALSYAAGRVPTPSGAIAVAWSRPAVATRPFKVNVTVPANTKARVSIPAAALDKVRESGMALSRREGVASASIDGAYAVVEVGAGSYHFTSTDVPVAAIGTGDGSSSRAKTEVPKR
jgi:alpha-L-rhamnosidase